MTIILGHPLLEGFNPLCHVAHQVRYLAFAKQEDNNQQYKHELQGAPSSSEHEILGHHVHVHSICRATRASRHSYLSRLLRTWPHARGMSSAASIAKRSMVVSFRAQ